MNFFWFYVPDDLLENFDVDLQSFYHDVLSQELDLSKSANAIGVKKALRDVANAYWKETVKKNASKILFDSSKKRCAYVLKHCPCFSSAVAKHFLQLLRRNPGILDKALHRRQINLCCLGGGPGTEAVAIIKVVDALNNSVLLRSKGMIHLSVTVVDLSEEWKKTAELVLKRAQRTPGLCDSEKIRISLELVRADLTEPLEEAVKKVILCADIVTMVYFVSAVNGSKVQDKCIPKLQNIMDLARPGALLLFLDSARATHYNSMTEATGKFENVKQIYGPYGQEFHTLSTRSIRKFIELYFDHFNALLCLTNCFITTAGWIKEDVVAAGSGIVAKSGDGPSPKSASTKPENRNWKKKVKTNTEKLEKFRRKVEKLLLSELKLDFVTDDLEERDPKQEQENLVVDRKELFAGKAKRKRILIEF